MICNDRCDNSKCTSKSNAINLKTGDWWWMDGPGEDNATKYNKLIVNCFMAFIIILRLCRRYVAMNFKIDQTDE